MNVFCKTYSNQSIQEQMKDVWNMIKLYSNRDKYEHESGDSQATS